MGKRYGFGIFLNKVVRMIEGALIERTVLNFIIATFHLISQDRLANLHLMGGFVQCQNKYVYLK